MLGKRLVTSILVFAISVVFLFFKTSEVHLYSIDNTDILMFLSSPQIILCDCLLGTEQVMMTMKRETNLL